VNTSSQLMLDELGIAVPGSSVLIIGGEADLIRGVHEIANTTRLVWMPYDIRERVALGADPPVEIHDVPLTVPDAPMGFEIVLIPGMPDRDLNRRSLLIAKQCVRPTGWVLVAGANNEGVRSFLDDALQVFGEPFFSDYRRKHRIATFEGIELTDRQPDWATDAGIQPGTWVETGVLLPRFRFMTATAAGVFAADGIDEGTRMLLDVLDIQPGQTVLDVGTGSGIIAAAARSLGGTVTATDANLIAICTARKTAMLNEDDSVEILAGDVYEPLGERRFDVIASNPPFHRGRATDSSVADRLIGEAGAHLNPGGSLMIVANGFLPYHRGLNRAFATVETLASNRRYRVYRASDPLGT
jgi:16S rRNA (guanine1207-N2)-methyltransferase